MNSHFPDGHFPEGHFPEGHFPEDIEVAPPSDAPSILPASLLVAHGVIHLSHGLGMRTTGQIVVVI